MLKNNNTVFLMETAKYRNYLLNCAVKLTKDKDDAEDLVQETYIRAFRFFNSYQIGSNCKSWMFKIMKNLFLNYLRKKKKYESLTARFGDFEYMFNDEANYRDNSIGDKSILAVNTVNDKYRILIILFHFENYSLKDISEYLHCPLGTVKSRLHRARAELRNLLIK
ncbi:MAG TPA: sigma-70 family RNA polymerase sigma factor [Ignavibacteria bacterium]|nr:sigma-70 family RNA polymerase sigma factor [Ignavibacteria bacterium]